MEITDFVQFSCVIANFFYFFFGTETSFRDLIYTLSFEMVLKFSHFLDPYS